MGNFRPLLTWVIDLDIKGFFDNLDHELVMQSVRKYTTNKWILLYIERWLKAPAQLSDGTLIPRDKGTPQGGVISPLLANIFLHLAFDNWIQEVFPRVPFERYADDGIVHCKSLKQVNYIKGHIQKRLAKWKLKLHPEKTKIVYCKDEWRKEPYPNVKFDFLGFTFQPRESKGDGKFFVGFNPAISDKAKKEIYQEMRSWRIHRRSDLDLEDIADMVNPKFEGWINYYGKFYKSALVRPFECFNKTLGRWTSRKYKRFRTSRRRAMSWLGRIAENEPDMFAHWKVGIAPSVGW